MSLFLEVPWVRHPPSPIDIDTRKNNGNRAGTGPPHDLKRKKGRNEKKRKEKKNLEFYLSLEHQAPCLLPFLCWYPPSSCNFIVPYKPAPPSLPTHPVNPQYALCAFALPQHDGLLIAFLLIPIRRLRGQNASLTGVPLVLGFATRCSGSSSGGEESGVPR